MTYNVFGEMLNLTQPQLLYEKLAELLCIILVMITLTVAVD